MRKTTESAKKIAPGIWQLNTTTFIVRAQPQDPRTGKKKNLRRLLENSSRREAFAVREDLLAGVLPEPSIPTRQETVADFAEFWIEYKATRGDLESSTLERYVLALGHLSKRLLASPLDALSVEVIESWMIRAKGQKSERAGKQYAPSTINGWLRVLRTMLQDAVRLRGLRFNAAKAVRPLVEPHDLEETNSLPKEELVRLLNELQKGDPSVAMAALVQAFTGLRWGEVSALKWKDLNAETRILQVCRKVVKGRLVPSTKTKRRRQVSVSVELVKHLYAYRARLVGIQAESDLMFPSSVGKPIWNSRISEALIAARLRAGITRRFSSQGFRRSLTDLLREASVDPVIAKAITGHSTDRMREHYSTVSTRDLQGAGDATGELLMPGLRLVHSAESVEKESTKESTGT